MTPLREGELFEVTFQTRQGSVGLLAEISIEGKTLHLKDIVVEPLESKRLRLDGDEVFAARRRLAETARAAGFDRLRVTGERLTGAKVGKRVDVEMDLMD